MTDAVVIGGGPAGAALATLLARAGRAVVLIERETGPVDKVCGEFLSREAGLYLASLGVDLAAFGAVQIDTVRLCEGPRVATVPLPFQASSVSRRVLDEALLATAVGAGATLRRGAKVVGLARADGGWAAELADGSLVEARDAFLATGKHDLPGHKRSGGLQNDLVAFKMYWKLAAPQTAQLHRHVELVLFDGGYAGLSLVENGRANLCLVLRRRRLAALGNRWENVLDALRTSSQHLEARLSGATPCAPRPLAMSSIPYGHVRHRSDGIWHLGDQAGVIPSFSGDGMSIALHSAELAAAVYLGGGAADEFQRRLGRDVVGQVMLATLLSHGLVRRSAQAGLGAVASRWPQLIASVAFHTRVSDAALARTSAHGPGRWSDPRQEYP